jgi:uncharacterized membrane protein YfcA
MLALMLGIGALGGLLSGLLGVGGAIFIIPLLLGLPPLFGLPPLPMVEVSGLSIIQVLAASLSGVLSHRRQAQVDGRTLLSLGLPMALFALTGAWLSTYVSEPALLAVFALFASSAFVLMLRRPPAGTVAVPRAAPLLPALAIGSGVGLVSGLVGAGGGFILSPLMVSFLGLSTRQAVGTGLGVVFIGSIAGALAKSLAGQVDWLLALCLVAGAVPAASLGALASHRLPERLIRFLLALFILASALQAWYQLFSR